MKSKVPNFSIISSLAGTRVIAISRYSYVLVEETYFWVDVEIEFIDGRFLTLGLAEDGQSVTIEISQASSFENKGNSKIDLTTQDNWKLLKDSKISDFEKLEVASPHGHTAGLKIIFESGSYFCYYNNGDEPLILFNELPSQELNFPYSLQPLK